MAPSATTGNRPRPLTILAAAFLAGGAAAVGLNHYLDVYLSQRKPVVESEPIFIAMRSLPSGAPITVWDVALRNWPKAMLPTTAMRVEDSFEGMQLKMPLREGQPLLSVQLEPTAAAPQMATTAADDGEMIAIDDRTKIQMNWPSRAPAEADARSRSTAAPAASAAPGDDRLSIQPPSDRLSVRSDNKPQMSRAEDDRLSVKPTDDRLSVRPPQTDRLSVRPVTAPTQTPLPPSQPVVATQPTATSTAASEQPATVSVVPEAAPLAAAQPAVTAQPETIVAAQQPEPVPLPTATPPAAAATPVAAPADQVAEALPAVGPTATAAEDTAVAELTIPTPVVPPPAAPAERVASKPQVATPPSAQTPLTSASVTPQPVVEAGTPRPAPTTARTASVRPLVPVSPPAPRAVPSQRHLVVPERIAVMVDEATAVATPPPAASPAAGNTAPLRRLTPPSTLSTSAGRDTMSVIRPADQAASAAPSAALRPNPLRSPTTKPATSTSQITPPPQPQAAVRVPPVILPSSMVPQARAGVGRVDEGETETDSQMFPRMSARIEKAGEDWNRFRESIFGSSTQE